MSTVHLVTCRFCVTCFFTVGIDSASFWREGSHEFPVPMFDGILFFQRGRASDCFSWMSLYRITLCVDASSLKLSLCVYVFSKTSYRNEILILGGKHEKMILHFMLYFRERLDVFLFFF